MGLITPWLAKETRRPRFARIAGDLGAGHVRLVDNLPRQGRINWPRVAVYAAVVAGPWAIIAALVVALAGCMTGEPMRTGAAVVPPRVDLALYITDPAKFPRPMHVKDCNDYAVENAARLRAEGRTPHFVVAYTERGVAHMVTSVDRNGETLIYDNRLPQPDTPIDWLMLPYKWIAREGDDHIWYAITADGGEALRQ